MPVQLQVACNHCRRTMAVPAGLGSGMRLRCPHCQQTFLWSADESTTRTLEQAAVSTAVSQESAPQATLTLVPQPLGVPDAMVSAAAPSPRKIGRFEIRRTLGEGGFGIVYEAHDPQLDRAIALKVAKLGGDSEQRIKRFLREAKSAANLRHPNIVPLYEFGQDGDQFYLALAYVPGQSLDHVISELNAKKEKMAPRQAATLMRYLAEALAYAHGLGIVHRDIKPHNVMLDERGDPLLMDFGLAARDEDEKLTREGAIMGTAAYLAPEQYRGEPTPASDQYSLGATLYELLTGETPFAGPPDVQIYNHLNVEPVSPRKRNAAVSRDLETICLKCLEKDAAKRYADCRALAEDLRRYLEGEPIAARPVGVVERVGKWSRKNRLSSFLAGTAATLLLAVLVTSIVGAAVAGYFAYDAKNQADAAKAAALFANSETERAKELAKDEEKARKEADSRREQAEKSALQVQFEHFHFRANDEPEYCVLGLASLYPKVSALKYQALQDSIGLHLDAWRHGVHRLRWMASHERTVAKLAFISDGKTVFTGSWDHTARLWDTASGKPVGPVLRHEGEIVAIALSLDGKTALTGSYDKTARLWNPVNGASLGPALQHQDIVIDVALSLDGVKAVTCSRDKTARLWDAATGKPLGPPLEHQGEVAAVAFAPDGKSVFTASHDRTVRRWNAITMMPLGPTFQHQDKVLSVAVSPDGKTLMTGCKDFTARLWDVDTAQPIGPPLKHRETVDIVTFSPDGKTALSGGGDSTIRLWDTANANPIGQPLQHQWNIVSAVFSPDSSMVLTGCHDKTARLWDANTGKPLGAPLIHPNYVECVAFGPDGKSVLTGGNDNIVRLWDLSAATPRIRTLHNHGTVVSLNIIANGKTLATGSWENARFWDAASGNPIGLTIEHKGLTGHVAFSPDGKFALTGGRDKAARLWNVTTGNLVGPPLQHQEMVNSVTFSPDGETLLTASAATARLWERATGKPLGPTFQHEADVRIAVFSPNGKTILTVGDRSARLWNAATTKALGALIQHKQFILTAVFSPDGKSVMTGSFDNTARIWDATTGIPISPPLSHQDHVYAVAFSPDNKTVLTGSHDNTARLWNAATGNPLGSPLRHHGWVESVAFSPDGRTVLTGSHDKSARLWETATGMSLGPAFRHQDGVQSVAFGPAGTTAYTGSFDGTARQWRVPEVFRGNPERVVLWSQVITGMEFDTNGALRVLAPDEWKQRHERLQELGGPPVSD